MKILTKQLLSALFPGTIKSHFSLIISKMSHPPATNLSGWRLTNVRGRQTWSYIKKQDDRERESNFVEKRALGLDTVNLISTNELVISCNTG